jgi:hypothetical protein
MMPPRALRRVAALIPLLGLLLVVPLSPAGASTTLVSVQDFSFTPATVTVGMGHTVTWAFHSMHTTTSNQRFWNSGRRSSGTYVVTFRDAGTFAYHCAMHPSMTGRVHVPMKAVASMTGGFTLRWSSRTSTPSNRRFDVAFKRVGATTWSWFRHGSAKRAGHFAPTRAGHYLVRARTRNVGVGASGWTPALTVAIS